MTTRIPDELQGLPKKMVLLGGGQFANQFIIVNVLEVHEAKNPFDMRPTDSTKCLQAKVEERRYSGIELFEPYLVSYHLHPLNPKYAKAPLDTYQDHMNGTAEGQYTKHLLK